MAAGAAGGGIDLLHIGELFFIEALGGAVFGLFSGYVAYRAMRAIDDYPIEVLISLALVTGTYTLAAKLHMSGPIAVVVAGLLIGNRGPHDALSDETQRYLFGFWTLIDEILNSVLFLLIGLEVLVLRLDPSFGWLAAIAVPLVLCARLFAVSVPVLALRATHTFVRGTIPVLTWGGLRGGISVALALSLPEVAEKSIILAATYAVNSFHHHRSGTEPASLGRTCRQVIGPLPEAARDAGGGTDSISRKETSLCRPSSQRALRKQRRLWNSVSRPTAESCG